MSRTRTRPAAALATVCAFLALPAAAQATTVAQCDEAAFRAAVAATPDGGTVDFDCDGTITVTGVAGEPAIDPAKSLTIDGTGHDVTISGNDQVALFFNTGDPVTGPRTLTLRHLTLSGGRAANEGGTGVGGAVWNIATLVVDDVDFVGNYADDSGGAIHSQSPFGTVTVTDSSFSGNNVACFTLCGASEFAAGGGGAISTRAGGTTRIERSSFENNYTRFYGAGGAIFGQWTRSNRLLGPIEIVDSVFKNNETRDSINDQSQRFRPGGGAVATVSHPLTITGSTFENNVANSTFAIAHGGAVLVADARQTLAPAPAVSITGSVFTDNRAVATTGLGGAGGALWTRAVSVDADSKEVSVSGSTFTGNVATSSGGAIENLGQLAVSNATIRDNRAAAGGGGGVRTAIGTTQISGSELIDNLTPNCVTDLSGTVVDGGGNTESPGKSCFGRADLAIVKTDSPDPVTAGQDVVYTLSVSNSGPDEATDVKATDALPAGMNFKAAGTSANCVNDAGTVTCDFGSIASGAAPETAQIVVTATTSGAIINTATVQGAEADSASGNNSSAATTQVNAAPGGGPGPPRPTPGPGPDPGPGPTPTPDPGPSPGPDPDPDPGPTPDPDPTIVGTGGADKLIGTPGDDVIDGMGGKDEIEGGGGDDIILGGGSADRIAGNGGDDQLFGGKGNDVLRGGVGDDQLEGNSGNDALNGNKDNDELRGGAGKRDVCAGGTGRDQSTGGCDTTRSIP